MKTTITYRKQLTIVFLNNSFGSHSFSTVTLALLLRMSTWFDNCKVNYLKTEFYNTLCMFFFYNYSDTLVIPKNEPSTKMREKTEMKIAQSLNGKVSPKTNVHKSPILK